MSSLISEMRPDELVSQLVANFPVLDISFDDQERANIRANQRCTADARIAFSNRSDDIQSRVKSLREVDKPTFIVLGPGELSLDGDALALAKQLCAGTNLIPLECKSADLMDVTISGVSAIRPETLESGQPERQERSAPARTGKRTVEGEKSSNRTPSTGSSTHWVLRSIERRYREEMRFLGEVRSDRPHIVFRHDVFRQPPATGGELLERFMEIGSNVRSARQGKATGVPCEPQDPFKSTWMYIHPDRIDLPSAMSVNGETNYLSYQYRECVARKSPKHVRLSVADAFFSVNATEAPFIGRPLAAYCEAAALCHQRLEIMGIRHQISTFPCDFLIGRSKICFWVLVEKKDVKDEREIRDALCQTIARGRYGRGVIIDVLAVADPQEVSATLRTLSTDGLSLIEQISKLNSGAAVIDSSRRR
jgi:hypothetical protein